jgi:hypothetical protein
MENSYREMRRRIGKNYFPIWKNKRELPEKGRASFLVILSIKGESGFA